MCVGYRLVSAIKQGNLSDGRSVCYLHTVAGVSVFLFFMFLVALLGYI